MSDERLRFGPVPSKNPGKCSNCDRQHAAGKMIAFDNWDSPASIWCTKCADAEVADGNGMWIHKEKALANKTRASRSDSEAPQKRNSVAKTDASSIAMPPDFSNFMQQMFSSWQQQQKAAVEDDENDADVHDLSEFSEDECDRFQAIYDDMSKELAKELNEKRIGLLKEIETAMKPVRELTDSISKIQTAQYELDKKFTTLKAEFAEVSKETASLRAFNAALKGVQNQMRTLQNQVDLLSGFDEETPDNVVELPLAKQE